MTDFTPVSGAIGGLIIGLSAVVLLLFKGRVAGLSGIIFGVFSKNLSEMSWRFAFLLGMVLGPLVAAPFGFNLPVKLDFSWPVILVAAFLVGFGTNMAGGCTSGHGICGVGRLAPRSITATLLFMGCAMLTVIIVNLLAGGGV
ncbi:MAG: YeeE/YedE thiosulfate transporter family protein [Enterobacterales bacterium]|nr:YeeE/YedE thiosulfate transporter family protein [Enterobacterales bacterium]